MARMQPARTSRSAPLRRTAARVLRYVGVSTLHGLVAMGCWQGLVVISPPWLGTPDPPLGGGRPADPPWEPQREPPPVPRAVVDGFVEDVIADLRAHTRTR
jgi:hypothetical protein